MKNTLTNVALLRRSLYLLPFLLLFVSFTGTEWVKVECHAAHCSVLMPKKPEITTGGDGDSSVVLYTIKIGEGIGSAYLFKCIDLSDQKDALTEEDISTEINSAQAEFAEVFEAKTYYTKDSTVNSYRYRDCIMMNRSGSANYTFRFYYVDNWLYVLGIISNAEKVNIPDQVNFFSSFKHDSNK